MKSILAPALLTPVLVTLALLAFFLAPTAANGSTGTPTESSLCTLAPAPPAGAPDDWSATVHANCFDDLQRLGKWVGGTEALQPGASPEADYLPVTAGSIGGTDTEVVVLAHGWAPGYRQAVDAADSQILWWSTGATNSEKVYSSDWAWTRTAVTTSEVSECVSATGFFQQLRSHSSGAVLLGFSWIDHSATGGSFSDLDEVYRSEAYTNIAGIRLANALEAALSADFWKGKGNRLHLIGHSHGSKVATVAALTLRQRERKVDQLTILDSPESEITLQGNGANLLGFYLEQMEIADPLTLEGGTFVDNHASFFGVSYDGLAKVVDVSLDPGALYSLDDPGNKHSYSAAWYAGAAAAVAKLGPKTTPLGLDWPPVPSTFGKAVAKGETLVQSFTAASGISNPCSDSPKLQAAQWKLSPGSPIGLFAYEAVPTWIEGDSEQNVDCVPKCSKPTSLTLKPGTDGSPAIFRGGYPNPITSDGFGLAFDITWSNASDGDYLVATVDSPEEGVVDFQEVILVMDGRSKPEGTYPVSFNADISGTLEDVGFAFYLVPGPGSEVEVDITNFRRILVTGF